MNVQVARRRYFWALAGWSLMAGYSYVAVNAGLRGSVCAQVDIWAVRVCGGETATILVRLAGLLLVASVAGFMVTGPRAFGLGHDLRGRVVHWSNLCNCGASAEWRGPFEEVARESAAWWAEHLAACPSEVALR